MHSTIRRIKKPAIGKNLCPLTQCFSSRWKGFRSRGNLHVNFFHFAQHFAVGIFLGFPTAPFFFFIMKHQLESDWSVTEKVSFSKLINRMLRTLKKRLNVSRNGGLNNVAGCSRNELIFATSNFGTLEDESLIWVEG